MSFSNKTLSWCGQITRCPNNLRDNHDITHFCNVSIEVRKREEVSQSQFDQVLRSSVCGCFAGGHLVSGLQTTEPQLLQKLLELKIERSPLENQSGKMHKLLDPETSECL